MKRVLKRMAKSQRVHQALAWVVALYIRFVLMSGRMHSHLAPGSRPYFAGEKPAIFALWHSRILLMQSHNPKTRVMSSLVSGHSDGRMVGRVLEHFGVRIIHGSTSKDGAQALKTLVRDYRAGHNISITPDGPRGPARMASDGVAQLVMLTHAPVICVGYAAKRHRRLRSWDRFLVALPFSRLHFVAAEPIIYVPDASLSRQENREQLRQQIERGINDVTDRADAYAQ